MMRTNRFPRPPAVLAACLLALLALPAAAHPGHGPAGAGFPAGLLHPFSGIDHLLALLALGVWSRQQAQGVLLRPVLPAVFLVLMALGASCAPALPGGPLPALEASIAASVLVLGALAGLALRPPPQLAVLAVAACGFVHGLAHGRELAGMASGAGFLLASALLMGVGMGLGGRIGNRARRLAGAVIGAAGLCLLAAAG